MKCASRARRRKCRSGSGKSLEHRPGAILRRLGPGQPLAGGERSRMERVFGADFREVRIHTGGDAHTMASEFGATAFTVGQHIAFGPGRFHPGTRVGDALLAHELAHTLQQKGSREVRQEVSGKSSAGVENDANRSARHALRALYREGGAPPGSAMPSVRTGTHLALSGCNTATGTCAVGGKFTHVPSGNLKPTMKGGRLGAPFSIEARFHPTVLDCKCTCGVYRQSIKGEAKGQGKPAELKLCNGKKLSTTDYQEDGKLVSGKCARYGYRKEPWRADDAESWFDAPDQDTGCIFNGSDNAGIQGGKSGDSLELNLSFKGELVDDCNKKVLETKEWTVKGTGQVP